MSFIKIWQAAGVVALLAHVVTGDLNRQNDGLNLTPARDWKTARSMADKFVAKLNLTEKADFVTGEISIGAGACVGKLNAIDRVGFPGICMQDGPAGVNLADLVSVFPSGVTLGASWDKDLIYAKGYALGQEFRDKGINMGLGPTAGPLGRHGLGGRNWEGFSPDPYLAGVAMALSVKGQQYQGVMSCAKHIVGNEQELQRSFTLDAAGNRIEGISSNIDDRTLHELYLWPFADAVKAGTTSVMCSYNRLNGTYACENSYLLKDILRGELGFEGFVVSDWFATHSGAKSINAGLDINQPGLLDIESSPTGNSYWGVQNITAMIKGGSVQMERLDEMIRAVMTPYYYLGQDTAEYPTVDPSLGYTFAAWQNVLDLLPQPPPDSRDVRADHSQLIRKIGAEATVLLKNINATLPLQKPATIGIFGNDAADPTDSLVFDHPFEIGTLDIGSGAGSARHTYIVSPLEAIRTHAKGWDANLQYILNNRLLAANNFAGLYPIPDICIVFINSFAGENKDRTSYEADWNSTLVVQNVADRCPNTIVVTHSVGVNVMPWADHPHVKAILAAHLPGQETGNSIADVLFGDVNPSGRLPYTIPYNASDYDIPIVNLTSLEAMDVDAWQSNFTEGLMIDYRHFDAHGITPRYEFGFGLSYTTFVMSGSLEITQDIKNLTARPDAFKATAPGGNPGLWEHVLKIGTDVTNTGDVAGSSVAQLYVSMPEVSVPDGTPVKVLRGFEKVFLNPGETKAVAFELMRRDLSYWDVIHQDWVIPKGNMTFKVGFSSLDIKAEAKHAVRSGSSGC